jgi:hypothetical protein
MTISCLSFATLKEKLRSKKLDLMILGTRVQRIGGRAPKKALFFATGIKKITIIQNSYSLNFDFKKYK